MGVASFGVQTPGFDPRPLYVRFAVDKVVKGQLFTEYFGCPLSMLFHRCSIFMFDLISTTLGQACECWEPSNKAMLYRISGGNERKGPSNLLYSLEKV